MVKPIIQSATQTLYDQDYYLWLKTTINQLHTGQFSVVDLDKRQLIALNFPLTYSPLSPLVL